VHAVFKWGNLREGDHLEDRGIDGRILKWILEEWHGELDSVCLRTGTAGGLL
jgi:hypothetical protein